MANWTETYWHDANREYTSSVKVTAPLVEQIMSQVHQLPEDSLIRSAQKEVRAERAENVEEKVERLKEVAPQKTRRALDLATEKSSSKGDGVQPEQEGV